MRFFEDNSSWIIIAVIVVFILFVSQDEGVNGGFFD